MLDLIYDGILHSQINILLICPDTLWVVLYYRAELHKIYLTDLLAFRAGF